MAYETSGTLVTLSKSFSNPQQPNLENLVYSLNGQSITVDVVGSPGTASEEIVSQSLDGASSYDLTWSSAHTDFRLEFSLSTSDDQTTPTTDSAALTSAESGTVFVYDGSSWNEHTVLTYDGSTWTESSNVTIQ